MFEAGLGHLMELLGMDVNSPEWAEEISRKMSGVDYNIDWPSFFSTEQWREVENYIMREQAHKTRELIQKSGDCEREKGWIQGLNFLLGLRESILGDIEAINQKKKEKAEENQNG